MRIKVDGIIRHVDSTGRLEISLPSVRYRNIQADGKAVILNNHPTIKHLTQPERLELKNRHVQVTIDILNDRPALPTAQGLIEEYFDNFVKPSETPLDPVEIKKYIRQWVLDTHYVSRRVLEQITAKLIMEIAPKFSCQVSKSGAIFRQRRVYCSISMMGIPHTAPYRSMVRSQWI
jgi:hypothetical protein